MNDNPPVMKPTSYSQTVPESDPIGTTLATLSVSNSCHEFSFFWLFDSHLCFFGGAGKLVDGLNG